MIVVSGNTPPLDSVVEVRRVTPRGDRLVDFVDGVALTEFDMDLADIQLLFLIQEDTDTLTDAILFDHAKNAWDMKGFRVTNVGEPIEDNDAVTLAYMQRYVAKYGGGGGGSGGDPGGGSGGSGGTLPPINVNIDEIKKDVLREVLPRIKEMEDAIKADVDEAVNRIADGLERLKNHNVNVLRSAGFVVDEENGTAKFQALEDFKTETGGRFTTVQQSLDAVNASLDLKASRAELEGATTRLSAAEASLDAAKADILLRASKTEVDEISQKLTQAEANIDGLNASISLKAEKAELTGVKDRLTAAELFINANGGNLQGVTIEFQGLRERLEELAQAIATNAETINNSNEIFDGKLALAKTELTSRIETAEGVVASLQNTVASISGEQVATAIQRIETMANDLQAETAARLTLAAKVGENTAAIQTEATVRAKETGALKAKYGVRVDAGGRVIGWEANNDGKRGDFDVYTDHFRIYSPDADKNAMPFHYDATSGKLKLNQIEVDGANIKSGSITNAHLSNVQITDSMLQNVTIDGAKIRNASITTSQLGSNSISEVSVLAPSGWTLFPGFTGPTQAPLPAQLGALAMGVNGIQAGTKIIVNCCGHSLVDSRLNMELYLRCYAGGRLISERYMVSHEGDTQRTASEAGIRVSIPFSSAAFLISTPAMSDFTARIYYTLTVPSVYGTIPYIRTSGVRDPFLSITLLKR